MAFAARRSNIDLVFKSSAGSDKFTTVAAPVYYDYQYIASIRPTDRDRVRVMMYGSSDRVELIFGKPSEDDPALRGDFELSTQFHRIQTSWHRDISESVSQDIQITAGPLTLRCGPGPGSKAAHQIVDVGGRAEWALSLSSRVRAVVGSTSRTSSTGEPIPAFNQAKTTLGAKRDRDTAQSERSLSEHRSRLILRYMRSWAFGLGTHC